MGRERMGEGKERDTYTKTEGDNSQGWAGPKPAVQISIWVSQDLGHHLQLPRMWDSWHRK